MSERSGRCLCGAVQYRLRGEPLAVRICWCRDCQHLASNGTVNALVSSADLEISGTLSEHLGTAASGNQMRRRFCPTCGTQMFNGSSARPQVTVLRVGTLDDPSSVKPSANIWTGSAPAWACLDPQLEAFAAQPPPPKPAAS